MNERIGEAQAGRMKYILSRVANLQKLKAPFVIPIDENAEWNVGGDHTIGGEQVNNSPLAANQFLVALSRPNEEDLDELLTDPKRTIDFNTLNEMIERKVLRGVRVLDLGCGEKPVFARTLRALGADVYTVDIFDASRFNVAGNRTNSPWREKEIQNHRVMDLRSLDWKERIRATCGGNFDIITSAHLSTPTRKQQGPFFSFDDVKSLLDSNGVYFNADHIVINKETVHVK